MIGGHCFFSFNASGCFLVLLFKNRKTIFPGVKKADAITATSSEGARETHPVRQSDLFRPVLNRTYSAEIPRLKGRPPSASSASADCVSGILAPLPTIMPDNDTTQILVLQGFSQYFFKNLRDENQHSPYGYFSFQIADKIEECKIKKFFILLAVTDKYTTSSVIASSDMLTGICCVKIQAQ